MDNVNMPLAVSQGVPPPEGDSQGLHYKPPKKGGLTFEVIAAIQNVYVSEQQKQEKLQDMATQSLQPGWGGQGR